MSDYRKNEFRIKYNPYKQKFDFERRSDSTERKWIPLSSDAIVLNEISDKDASLINEGWTILHEIDKLYNKGNVGINVHYLGTKDDYDDLNVIYDSKKKELKREGKGFSLIDEIDKLPTAKNAMATIEKAYKEIADELKPYLKGSVLYKENPSIGDAVDEYNKIRSISNISIAVIGNYSTGKSTFINAIMGAELLPIGIEPETALIYYIKDNQDGQDGNDTRYRIDFKYKNEQVCIKFYEDGKCKFDNFDRKNNGEIIDAIDKKTDDSKTIYENMNAAISVINDKEMSNNIDDYKVEIFLPFKNHIFLNNDYITTIIDTPGSNSETFKNRHTPVLKKALEQQNDTLPIFLTERKVDATDNFELLRIAKNENNGIDVANMLVVINKADELDGDEFNIRGDILEEWKHNKILFVSAIMALGSRISEDQWIYTNVTKAKFERNADYFSNKNPTNSRKLFEYNYYPHGSRNEAEEDVSDNPIFVNSGFSALFNEIRNFAYKYALCIKVKSAREKLLSALDSVDDECKKKYKELEGVKAKNETERKQIAEKFTTDISSMKLPSNLQEDITKKLKSEFESEIKTFKDNNYNEDKINKTWKDRKKRDIWDKTSFGNKREAARKDIYKEINNTVNEFLSGIFDIALPKIHENMIKAQEDFCNQIIELIDSEDTITEEAKEQIRKIPIEPLDSVISYEEFKSDAVGIFGGIRASWSNSLCNAIDEHFLNGVLITPINTMKGELDEWIKTYKKDTIGQLGTKSGIIRKLDEQITEKDKEIKDLTERINRLKSTKGTLVNLLEYKEKADDEWSR